MNKEYLESLKKIKQEFNCDPEYYGLGVDFEILESAIHRLEAIDNANPSEALECLEYIETKLAGLRCECERIKSHRCDDLFIQEHIFTTIKQALLKAQEQKQYLKWEDLEFGVPTSLPPTIKVKMGDTQYCLCLRISLSDVKSVVLRDNNLKPILHLFEKEKQIFNDLHLERVEE